MKTIFLSLSLLLNSYCLPVPIEKSHNYTKEMVVVKDNEDLSKISNRFFNLEFVTYKKLETGDDLAESGKGSTIYFAYSNDGRALAVIKQVPVEDGYDRAELKDEISSLYERYFRNTKNFTVPRLIGTAEFSSEERSSAYIIETVAQGQSINGLIKEVAGAKGIQRARKMDVLKKAMEKTAASFAEFHLLQPKSSYSTFYDSYYSDAKEGTFKGPYGIIHGDAHLGNIFYDEKSKKTTFIDLSFMPESLKGAPVGLDTGKFIFSLEALGSFYGLSESEISELTKIYTKTYLAHNPKMTEGLMAQYTEIAYKNYAFPSGYYLSDKTDQGAYLYTFAMNKVGSSGKTLI